MQHLLVLQWPGSTEADFEVLIKMEDELERSLGSGTSVDGHDFGSGEMNIFIETDQPTQAFGEARAILGHWPLWAEVRAAHRQTGGETYTVLSPVGLTEFRIK